MGVLFPEVGDRALFNSSLKSSPPAPPGLSNVSVLLQSSWASLFNFLAAKLHSLGKAVGCTCAVPHTPSHFLTKCTLPELALLSWDFTWKHNVPEGL